MPFFAPALWLEMGACTGKEKVAGRKGKEKYKKDVGRPSKEKSLSIIDNNKFTDNIPKQEPKHSTQKELAKELNWSTGKVAMADKVWKETDDYTKEKIKKGEETISGAYRKLTEQNRKAERKKTIANEPKEIDNFERLKKHALALAEGLQFWADGTIQPESENEAVAARTIRHAAPSIIKQYSRLGINIPVICETFRCDANEKRIKRIQQGPSDAMAFATMAISQLERIQPEDPESNEAFDYLLNWIEGKKWKQHN